MRYKATKRNLTTDAHSPSHMLKVVCSSCRCNCLCETKKKGIHFEENCCRLQISHLLCQNSLQKLTVSLTYFNLHSIDFLDNGRFSTTWTVNQILQHMGDLALMCLADNFIIQKIEDESTGKLVHWRNL